MNKQERTKIRNAINRQYNRLRQKGANPQDINKYFGYTMQKGLKDVSDSQLLAIKETYQARPSVEIKNNNIYPKGYTAKHDFLMNSNGNYANSFNKRFSSQLNKNTLSVIKKNQKNKEKKIKEDYINMMKDLGVSDDIIKRAKSLTYNDFYSIVSYSGGLVSFEKVFYGTNEEIEEYNTGVTHSLKEDLEMFFR